MNRLDFIAHTGNRKQTREENDSKIEQATNRIIHIVEMARELNRYRNEGANISNENGSYPTVIRVKLEKFQEVVFKVEARDWFIFQDVYSSYERDVGMRLIPKVFPEWVDFSGDPKDNDMFIENGKIYGIRKGGKKTLLARVY